MSWQPNLLEPLQLSTNNLFLKHVPKSAALSCVADKSYDYVLEPSPVSLPLVNPQETRVLQVSCGRAHSLVLTDAEGGQQTLLCFIVIIEHLSVARGLLIMNKVVFIGAQILYKVN